MDSDDSNLLTETLAMLKQNGKAPSDVLWVGSREIRTTWEQFASIADIVYDSGYGSAMVASDLLIVGSNWWLERGEYDGSEWWEYKELPTMPSCRKPLAKVVSNRYGGSLKEILTEK